METEAKAPGRCENAPAEQKPPAEDLPAVPDADVCAAAEQIASTAAVQAGSAETVLEIEMAGTAVAAAAVAVKIAEAAAAEEVEAPRRVRGTAPPSPLQPAGSPPIEDPLDRICRICLCATSIHGSTELISPCACKGSMKYVHSACLKMWWYRDSFTARSQRCEQCLSRYNISSKLPSERALVHAATVTAMLSTYVLACLLSRPFIEMLWHREVNTLGALGDLRYFLLPQLTVYIVVAKMLVGYRLLTQFSFLFSFWRLLYFNFVFDRLFYMVTAVSFLREVYMWMYMQMDYYYFILKAQ